MLSSYEEIEIAKFQQHSNAWWDKSGPFATLHEINDLRSRWIAQWVDLKGRLVLDVGCGGGLLADRLSRIYKAKVVGLDLDSQAIAVAKQHAQAVQNESVDFFNKGIADLLLDRQYSHKFDVVTCLEVLEHVANPIEMIRGCSELVKPQGWVFLSTLNRSATSYFESVVVAEYLLNLLPKGLHDYNHFIKPSEMAEYCRDSELFVKNITGVSYNPWSRRFRLIAVPKTNYLIATQKLTFDDDKSRFV
ncbi:MAG: bifunctional 2-polyprenyl-6-hydroxyphenol methylase/3-demethylubiquinol 3-O-methyltransferase UbiG [Gammaproteobacteria bacterium]|nr:bifunctional 2-polyprenyl-6-hydroxyphenol methylase/3-demethylubiquinol 3-O-methyltransferase UbiG [Gammaproteobacteria bacterium]